MAFYQFKKQQIITASIEAVWNFVSSPLNLQKITPPDMGFIITSENPDQKMYPGMVISYHVKPLLGITTTWVTEITQVLELKYFVDEQRIGPYKMWHHQHLLEPLKNGVLMTDIISYQPPFGFLGAIANELVIRKKLNEIFDYRKLVLEQVFDN
jgi:ligand-binding SRPBCC domain-containing protein